ncbi:MAG: OsmC family protein [Halobacteria archaeon]|nr:OsmC family protein [Halobacteria archaeon]
MVIDWNLQEKIWNELETLRGADRVPMGKNKVETELIENLYARGKAREFSFEADEPKSVVGGQNRGPRPLEYFLAGFAFCQQVIYAKNALATGIEIDSISIEASGDVDPRGVFGVGDTEPGFANDEITYTTHIESEANREEVAELVRIAERQCPAHASLRKPVELRREIMVNGEKLDI